MDKRGQAPGGATNVDRATEVDVDALGDRMRAVARAQHKFNVSVAHVMGLAPNDVWALEHLLADGPLGPADLARRLGMTSASATTLVDRLEAAGHISRRPHLTDRRRLVVAPTEQASHEAYAAIAPFLADLEAAGADLTEDERTVVVRYLDRVIAALRALGEADDTR